LNYYYHFRRHGICLITTAPAGYAKLRVGIVFVIVDANTAAGNNIIIANVIDAAGIEIFIIIIIASVFTAGIVKI
jgi:hypothetical protein